MTRRTHDIDDDTWRMLRVRAASEDKALSEVAADAIRAYGLPPLSFKNADGVELFDGTIPMPMRETVRTVETKDLPGGRLREQQSHARTTVTVPRPGAVAAQVFLGAEGPRPVSALPFTPVPKPGAAKPGARQRR